MLAEAYTILHHTLGISNKDIKDIFAEWNTKGELSDNFLVDLGALITGFTHGDGITDRKGIIDDIEDKVTQDVDDSEGSVHRHQAQSPFADIERKFRYWCLDC